MLQNLTLDFHLAKCTELIIKWFSTWALWGTGCLESSKSIKYWESYKAVWIMILLLGVSNPFTNKWLVFVGVETTPRFSGMHGPLSSVPQAPCEYLSAVPVTTSWIYKHTGPAGDNERTIIYWNVHCLPPRGPQCYLREMSAASALSSWGPETCCSAFPLVIQLRAGGEELMGFQADDFLIASLLVGKRHVSLEEMIQTTLGAIPHPLWWLRSELMTTECCWGCR